MTTKKIKITNSSVEKLALTKAGQEIYWDTELKCFGVKVGTASKSYFVQRRVNNRTRQVKIARTHEMNADMARQEAKNLLVDMGKGTDPVKERRAASVRGRTFREAFDEFRAVRVGKLSPGTIRGYDDFLKNHLSDWERKPLTDIDSVMVCDRHKRMCKEGKAGAADNCMRLVSAVFNYAMIDNHALQNPVVVLKLKKLWGEKTRRDNWLRPHQLRPWYKAVRNLSNQTIKDYLLFLLYSGLRKNEGLKLRWKNIFVKDKSFLVEDTKNRIPLYLPLSQPLLDIIKRRRKTRGNSPYVFDGSGKAGHMIEPGRGVEAVSKESKVDFILQDLRRTFITYTERQDISQYALKRLVNHKMDKGDVTSGYIGADVERLRKPMQAVADEINSHMLKKAKSK